MIWTNPFAQFAAVAALIALMSFCKLGWHGRWRKSPWLLMGHLLCIVTLQCHQGFWTGPWWLAWAGTLGAWSALASYHILDHKPRMEWWWRPLWVREIWTDDPTPYELHPKWRFIRPERRWLDMEPGCIYQRRYPDRWHVPSMLSTLPIQVAAAASVVWSLVQGGPPWSPYAATIFFTVEGLWLKYWLWQRPSLRPEHWG